MNRRAVLLAGAALAVACKRGPEQTEIELVMGVGGRASLGFKCVGADGPLMGVDQICTGARCGFSLMIDFVDMGPPDGEAPSCRPLEFRQRCNDPAHPCTTIDAARVCRDVEFRIMDGVPQCDRLLEAIANVEQALVTDDAPDRLVYVRAVALRGTCASYGYDPTPPVAPTARELYQTTELIGCAQSCPVVLDNWRGPLTLDLDVAADTCNVDTLLSCAHGTFDAIPPLTCGD